MSLFLHRAGLMATLPGTKEFPTLRSTSNSAPGAFTTSHTVGLPSGIQAGDLVILSVSARATNTGLNAINVPAGWTSLAYDTSNAVSFCRTIYRIAEGAMSSVTVQTPGQNTGMTSNGYCFSAYSEMPIVSGYATGEGAAPNPPSLNIPRGWGIKPHKLCISLMHLMGNVTANGVSSGYGNQLSSLSSNNNRTYSARREVRSSDPEDPGPWSISGTNPSTQNWWAATIAVRGI